MTESEPKKIKVLVAGGDRGAGKALKAQMELLEELEEYRAIGTVSEFRELKEKATAKEPYYVYLDEPLCPHCHMILDGDEEYCECGQKLDWSEGKE